MRQFFRGLLSTFEDIPWYELGQFVGQLSVAVAAMFLVAASGYLIGRAV